METSKQTDFLTILPDPSSSIRSTTQVISVITSFFPAFATFLSGEPQVLEAKEDIFIYS
jgi:hypothetical protein